MLIDLRKFPQQFFALSFAYLKLVIKNCLFKLFLTTRKYKKLINFLQFEKNKMTKAENQTTNDVAKPIQINKGNINYSVHIRPNDLFEYACENTLFPITDPSSLLDGILFIETHGLHNIRYFSPYNNHEYISDQSCTQYLDKSSLTEEKNILKLTTMLCKLFPSDLGTISIETSSNDNFYSFLSFIKNNSTQRNDIKILAALLFCTCNAKNSTSEIILNNSEFSLRIKSNYLITNCYSIYINLFDPTIANKYKLVVELLRTLVNVDATNDILSSNLIIKSFIAHYLNGSDLGQFYGHYREIVDFFGKKIELDQDKFKIEKIEKNLRLICSSFQFPYEKSCELPYALVPIDKQIQPHLKKPLGYWNCVENSLYHFINCILWDGDNDRYMKIKSKIPCVIENIFSGKMRSTPDKDTLELWHKIIEDLPSGYNCDQKLEYKKMIFSYNESIERIFYVQKVNLIENDQKCIYNFEIETGFINFIKVFEVITNKQGILIEALKSALLKDKSDNVVDIDFSMLEKCFHYIIELLIGSENSQNYKVQLKNAYYSCLYGRKDIYGELWIRIKYPKKGAEVEFMLSQEPGHAFVAVTMIDEPTTSMENLSDEVYEWLNEKSPFLGFLIKSYTNSFIKKNQNNNFIECFDLYNDDKIHEIMIGFRLEANIQTNLLLSKLINQYILNGSDCNLFYRRKVKHFCINVLNGLPIYDPETLKLFIYPIYTMKDLLQIDLIILDELEEIHDFRASSYSYKIHSDSILIHSLKKIDNFFQKEFQKAKNKEFGRYQITYSENQCSDLKVFLDKKSNLIIDRFESYSKSTNICLFELKDTLDNIVCFLLIYGSFFIFDEISFKILNILDYYMLMNMAFSENVDRQTMIGYIDSFVGNFKNEKFDKILSIAKIIENYEKKRFSKCFQIIKNKILDYDIGIKIILSCPINDKENKLKTLLVKACDHDQKKIYIENLISKHEELVFNQMSSRFKDSINIPETFFDDLIIQ